MKEIKKVNPFIDFPINKDEELRLLDYKGCKKNSYYITNTGKFFSTVNQEVEQHEFDNRDKFKAVKLSKENGDKPIIEKIGYLVADTFIESKPSEDSFLIYKDGNKINNNADNLKWGSKKEMTINKYNTGTYKGLEKVGGINNILKIADLLETEKYTCKEIAEKCSVNLDVVKNMKTKNSYRGIIGTRKFHKD